MKADLFTCCASGAVHTSSQVASMILEAPAYTRHHYTRHQAVIWLNDGLHETDVLELGKDHEMGRFSDLRAFLEPGW